MGKKSKANRKKAAIVTSTATTAPPSQSSPMAAVATAETELLPGEFPESTFSVKGKYFLMKGNRSKAFKMFVEGIENGCVHCMNEYTTKHLVLGKKMQTRDLAELVKNNTNLHLALPLALEGAIRGSSKAIRPICGIYCQVSHEKEDVYRYGHIQPATPLILYWTKHDSKNYAKELSTKTKQTREEQKEHHGTMCSVCQKHDSETVTLQKCDGCHFFYYCSKECQKKMWQEGQHAGVCRHLGLLNKYHKPFAKKIWTDIAVHGIAPQDIPELQELRHRLGLSRPQEDYQGRLDEAQALCLDSTKLVLPRKDGTVQIGSFPRPI